MNEAINDSGMWTITNERHGASPLLGFLPLFSSMATDIGKYLGEDIEIETLVEFSKRHVRMAAIESQWEQAGAMTVERLKSVEFVKWIVDGLSHETLNLNKFGDTLCGANLSKYSSQKIAEKISDAMKVLKNFIIYNNFINASDFYHEILTKRILERLRISLGPDASVTADVVYFTLTTPEKTVWIQEEEVDFLKILAFVQSDKKLESLVRSGDKSVFFHGGENNLQSLLYAHEQKYFWIRYEQEGEMLTSMYFFSMLIHMLGEGINAKDELRHAYERKLRAKEQFNAISSKISLSNDVNHLLEVARKFVYWKLHLREIKIRFYCCMDGIMNEAAKRLSLNRYQVRHLTVDELTSALRGRTELDAATLNHRIEYCVFHFTAGKIAVYEGQHARDVFSVVGDRNDASIPNKIHGVCAYPGIAKGVVKQVLNIEDGDHFPRGNVLVAYMTDVGVVSAMKKASAIVTDVGGVTCHASIIAREFNIPCVIGTKIATKVLSDGYVVEVNATEGFITILSKKRTLEDDTQINTVEEDEDLIDQNFKIPILRSTHLSTEYIRGFKELTLDDVKIAGGKGAALGELTKRNFPVPSGFVILTSAFEEFFFGSALGLQINKLLGEISNQKSLRKNSQVIRDLITNMDLSLGFVDVVSSAFMRLSSEYVAVRSSAISEDSITSSWAGQLESYLNTTSDDLLLNIKKCWASLFSDRAILYRAHCGLNAGEMITAVVVQNMVASRIAGTAFSVHPVTGNLNSVLIESCIGLGETLVLGKETPTSFIVEKDTLKITSRDFNLQKNALRRARCGIGNELFALSVADISANILSEREALEVASLAIDLENNFGFPVDVEWAYEESNLCLLQSRPITTLLNKI